MSDESSPQNKIPADDVRTFYQEVPRIEVNADNVHAISRRLHLSAMTHMGIPLGSVLEAFFLGNAFEGEASELQNEIKKAGRDGYSPEQLAKIRGEVGDVLAHLEHICAFYGIDPWDCLVERVSHIVNERKPLWTQAAIAKLHRDVQLERKI